MCVLVVLVLGGLVAGLRRSALGQRMLAVRSNERAAAAAGIDVRRTKLTAFALASVIAGLAGGLYAYDYGSVTADNFSVAMALSFVAFAYLGGITTVSGAVVGGLLVTDGLAIHAANVWFGVPVAYQQLIAGLALIQTIMFNPRGIAGTVGGLVRRQLALRRPAAAEEPIGLADDALAMDAANPAARKVAGA